MEDLIELVAASLARHGIKCPDSDSGVVSGRPAIPVRAVGAAGATERGLTVESIALPEHNFGNHSRPDPTP